MGQLKNYAREYVLCDGSYGVDSTQTINSNPIPLKFSLLATDITGIDFNSSSYINNASLQNNKRVLFNYDSSNNHFDYVCPGIQAVKWYNGKPVTGMIRGVAESITATDLGN